MTKIRLNTGTSSSPIWKEIELGGKSGTGQDSTVEGRLTYAVGAASHAEGLSTLANPVYSVTKSVAGTTAPYTLEIDPTSLSTLNKIVTSAFLVGDKVYTTYGDAGWTATVLAVTGNVLTVDVLPMVNVRGMKPIPAGEVLYNISRSNASWGHSEGRNSVAIGDASHAEGQDTFAFGINSHAEGYGSIASGVNSHAQGMSTIASGKMAHVEGQDNKAIGDVSHVEGRNNSAYITGDHVEGVGNLTAYGTPIKVTAFNTSAKTITLESTENVWGLSVAAKILVRDDGNTIEDVITGISGNVVTLTTFEPTTATNYVVVPDPEGGDVPNHAEGGDTIACGGYSHAEGLSNIAASTGAHAEGYGTIAKGSAAHSEGFNTLADGNYTHAEGSSTKALGSASHAEGNSSQAIGNNSHSQNEGTIAQGKSQTALGRFNVAQGTASSQVNTDLALIIGNGTSDVARSNALTVDWSGNVVIAGQITGSSAAPTSAQHLVNKAYLDAQIALARAYAP